MKSWALQNVGYENDENVYLNLKILTDSGHTVNSIVSVANHKPVVQSINYSTLA